MKVSVTPTSIPRAYPDYFVFTYAQMDAALARHNAAAYAQFLAADFTGRDATGTSFTLEDKEKLAAPGLKVRENLYDLREDGASIVADVQTISSDGTNRVLTWSHQTWLRRMQGWRLSDEQGFALTRAQGNNIVQDVHPPGMRTWQ